MWYATLVVIANHIFLAFLLFFSPRFANLPNRLLGGQLIIYALVHSSGLITLENNSSLYQYYFGLEYCVALLMGPSIYFYTKSLLGKRIMTSKLSMLHFLPSGLAFVGFIYIHIISRQYSDIFTNFSSKSYSQLIYFLDSISFLTIILYLLFSISIYRKAKKEDMPSLRQQLKWLSFYFRCTLFLSFLVLPMGLVDNGFLAGMFMPLVTLVYFYMITWKIVQTELAKPKVTKQTNQSSVSEKTIKSYVEENKPFLNPDLTLTDLASQLSVPRSQLSYFLNTELEIGFYEFINSYRVNEVKRRLLDPKYRNYTIEAIAKEAGFNSRTCFYESFKKETDMSPKEFRKAIPISEN